ncbi:MAG: nitric-oxide reductase large subunit [Limnospira sp. PMC 1291.21]|uniref:nitric-oxide reductase large subunit n=1 Tax=unclassified Limnospira TaxID=2642885 RepID=UPI0028E0AB85|nr:MULTISPECIES: nitric-oxide reductase large subunit [unclassified Limnospira]MDT9176251.1 nitric-oxide reductase large subunit [Limnospira sp. PMC 1238.20]MDT9191557.1 nitric-oxide reductase large subunit [Limnospira sp. PMC 1245.20]MDT9201750.1 nitric-oxide reductase large subunit [Limnospira sp. PMC 1243.20]MDT9207103.1 nitric-oxide reductase large subunit [Limnospira sp. PMC 1252.20]MDT9212168.1 nitric-oxide reductase large subunit [Limnospira sp. PMC 1256.20]
MANLTLDRVTTTGGSSRQFSLPTWLVLICIVTFTVLISAGAAIYKNAPPIPATIVSPQQEMILSQAEIQQGQETYLARGGQHIGSVWGHGSYLAPDWTADVLHRWGLATAGVIYNSNPVFTQEDLESLPDIDRATLQIQVEKQFKTNRYDPETKALTLTEAQTIGLQKVFEDYQTWLSQGSVVHSIPSGWFTDNTQIHNVTAFFAWTAWAASANRPNAPFSYTANFPHDDLIGNQAPPQFLIWSIVSVIVLIAAIAVFLFIYLTQEDPEEVQVVKERPSIRLATPSQKVTTLFFGVAMALFLVQILMGMVTAHYAVEGDGFYGVPLQQYLPYAASRTWHLQLAVFWIATCWLAAGLYFAPRFGKNEPPGQSWGNGALLGALTVVVVGSLIGAWAGVQGLLGDKSFWFGHQGYEYVELGRLWQLLLIGGMVFWLWLMYRALKPALKAEGSKTGLNHFFLYSAITIPLFYASGLMYTNHTPLSIAEYWRWWVVHLWVEGFFEVFATVTIAYLCSELGFLKRSSALRATYLTTILYLGSGVIGTLHHLYFSGTPVFITAMGAVASALEVVPLTLIGFEVVKSIRLSQEAQGFYRVPLKFFIGTCFWNLVGAGVFGFLINPPIVLYYSQGINTTPIHAHSALFGVYGSLALALMLFALREITPDHAWNEKLFNLSFWGINIGLVMMMLFGLIPSGFYQLVQSVNYGTWYARSAEVINSSWMHWTVWLRIPGDIVFSLGALLMVLCVLRSIIAIFQQPTQPQPDAPLTADYPM